ncbi:MAG: IS66 family transposase, partial [Pseudobutyrivibrio sp.]|nr:IS66 family transposase [Pseudobutyrivibrio sp.]
MAIKYTEEQLNTLDKSILINLVLGLQTDVESLSTEISGLREEVHSVNEKMQLLMEQLILAKHNRFGRSSEKMDDYNQISFMEVDGNIVFFN